MLIRTFYCLAIIAAVSTVAFAQGLPSKIRGYKVYNAKISVSTPESKTSSDADARLKVYDPELDSIGLDGVVLTVGGEVSAAGQNGKVDFLEFRDFRINGVAVAIDEYTHKFAFKERQTVVLPEPVRVRISKTSIATAAFQELLGSKEKWSVTGTVLVFGTFRKFGFGFKRVIPVRIDILIKNPVKPFTDILE